MAGGWVGGGREERSMRGGRGRDGGIRKSRKQGGKRDILLFIRTNLCFDLESLMISYILHKNDHTYTKSFS